MNQTTTAPHLERIIRALGDKIGSELSEQDIEAEFQRYLDYGVPPEQAERTILRNHGAGDGPAPGAGGERVPLEQVKAGMNSVNLLVRVVHIENRTIEVKGEPKEITSGLLGDETMTLGFTSWKPLEFEKGDVLKVTGAYTREFRGQPEIQFGDRVSIEKGDPGDLPEDVDSTRTYELGDLKPGMRNVEVTARVLSVESREVNVKGEPKTVWSGMLGDATGKVEFSAWHDFGLKEGELVKVGGGYVRAWRGTPQLSFDDRSTLERVEDESVPTLEQIDAQGPVAIGRFLAGGGQLDVVVEGAVIDIRPGSGLVERCSDCSRVLRDGSCGVHGEVEGQPDLRVKAIVDDGTGSLMALFNREMTEAVLGKDLAACQAMAKEASTPDVVEDAIKTALQARTYRVRGNVLTDEYGPMLIARQAEPVQRDVEAAAEALLAELAEVA